MKFRQLFEGQREQIAGLRPNSPIMVYHPTDFASAVEALARPAGEKEQYVVTPSLRTAKELGTVVLKFWVKGKNLRAPRWIERSISDKIRAQQQYLESYQPLVSYALLSVQNPQALFEGSLLPDNVQEVYIIDFNKEKNDVEAGQIAEYEPEEFLRWFVTTMRKRRQQKENIGARLDLLYGEHTH